MWTLVFLLLESDGLEEFFKEMRSKLKGVFEGELVRLGPYAYSLDLSEESGLDLNLLKGIPLVELDLSDSDVRDLTPLRGFPIKKLNLSRTKAK